MASAHETDLLTVAAIRRHKTRPTEYLFHEHARIFTVSADAAAATVATRLDQARRKRRPVHVEVDTTRGAIHLVEEATPEDVAQLARLRVPLEKPSAIRAIDVRRIDPTTFDLVGHHLKWPVFKKCTKIVPSYTKARQIFDFCAALSCHLPGPPAVAPCIPFQYVIDGCYARAHQMRRVITARYRYCCEKVFSFATAGSDRLAVKADKWGGCCVTWWYHVAPLVRVRVRVRGLRPPHRLVMAMVIDPGMFDKPVLLSTWLAAQETTACHPNANVTSYSIQPGSAYTPAFGGGFTTDPAYAATETTLVHYQTFTTCP